MSVIPLGQQAYRRDNSFTPEVELLNLYVEKDESAATGGVVLLQRPSLRLMHQFVAPIRGVFQQDGVFNGRWFVVAGASMFAGDGTAFTRLGGIDGIDRVEIAATYAALYVAGGGNLYVYDGTAVTQIAMPDGRAVQSIDTLDGYLIALNPDGRFYWLEPGETEIDPLNFATAESAPDGGVAVRRLVDEVWFFGGTSIEPWQATGSAEAPFQRASGRVYDRGARSRDAVQRFDNGIVWVGDDGIVYRTSNVPQALSTSGIEERLRDATALPSVFTFDSDGHKFWMLKVPGQGDFAYDARSQAWSRFASASSDDWTPSVGQGGYCAGGNSLWALDASLPDDSDGSYIKRASGTVALLGKGMRQASASFSVGSSMATTYRLRWRDADEDFPDYWEEFYANKGADVFSLWRMGQVRQPYRTFEIEHDSSARVRFSDATMNDSRA